jgi:hypothetical protein
MSDKETDLEELAIDPPDNQGGSNLSESSSTDAAPIDPPDNQGGGSTS